MLSLIKFEAYDFVPAYYTVFLSMPPCNGVTCDISAVSLRSEFSSA